MFLSPRAAAVSAELMTIIADIFALT